LSKESGGNETAVERGGVKYVGGVGDDVEAHLRGSGFISLPNTSRCLLVCVFSIRYRMNVYVYECFVLLALCCEFVNGLLDDVTSLSQLLLIDDQGWGETDGVTMGWLGE